VQRIEVRDLDAGTSGASDTRLEQEQSHYGCSSLDRVRRKGAGSRRDSSCKLGTGLSIGTELISPGAKTITAHLFGRSALAWWKDRQSLWCTPTNSSRPFATRWLRLL